MSFDNEYKNRKDRRKRYYRSGRFDVSCRPHGSCPYCLGNRTHKHNKKELSAREQIKEFLKCEE